jgi:type II secretory pathway pseudopilin PulG
MVSDFRIKKVALSAGFGLVELMVSISIMVLVTSVILARHDSYNGATLLRSQAYEVALSIREMQLLAVSAARNTSGYRNVYGLTFSTSSPNSIIIFRDADGDYFYDVGEEFGKQGVIDGRFEIDALRFIGTGADADAGVQTAVTMLFERPNFDARLYKAASTTVNAAVYGVEIDIRLQGTTGNGPGEVRTIEVTRAGQISVKNI